MVPSTIAGDRKPDVLDRLEGGLFRCRVRGSLVWVLILEVRMRWTWVVTLMFLYPYLFLESAAKKAYGVVIPYPSQFQSGPNPTIDSPYTFSLNFLLLYIADVHGL